MDNVIFRGKRIENGEWVYGYYVKHLPFTPYVTQKVEESEYEHYIMKDGFSDWGMPRNTEHFQVIPETVGMYTGLKDYNHQDVYEGDILEHNYDKGLINWIVCYNKGILGIENIGSPIFFNVDSIYYFNTREVIRNIHENVELMENK